MPPIRWAIAGTGAIAGAVAQDFAHVHDAELAAVGSRAQERADAFAREHAIPRAHGSYRALLADPDVDVVYVATPHPQHHAIAVAALRAGKAVLVEKAFTATPAGAREIADEARRRGLFAMEAMWTRFQPAIVRLRELVRAGEIGDIVAVQADLGIARPYDPRHRLFAPELGGGALLDLGVYVVSFAQMLFGAPESVVATGARAPNGVDSDVGLLLSWAEGRSAGLVVSLRCPTPGGARVFGTTGWIEVAPRFHHSERLVVHREGRPPEPLLLPRLGRGYSHELAEVTRCLREGRTESAAMPLDDTLAVMAALEEAGRQLGVSWREDPDVDV